MEDVVDQIQGVLKETNPLYIKVKVLPKSPKTEIVELMQDDTIKIRVAAPPTGGKANQELMKFLNKTFSAEISIISGHADRNKLVKLTA